MYVTREDSKLIQDELRTVANKVCGVEFNDYCEFEDTVAFIVEKQCPTLVYYGDIDWTNVRNFIRENVESIFISGENMKIQN